MDLYRCRTHLHWGNRIIKAKKIYYDIFRRERKYERKKEAKNLGLSSTGSQNEHTQIIPDMRSHTYYDRKMPLVNGKMSMATIRPKTPNKRVCSDNFDFIWCKNLNDDLAAI